MRGRSLAVLIKKTRRWRRHGGRQGGEKLHLLYGKEVWGDGEIWVLDATYQNKHVILKEDMRTWAWGKQITCQRSESDKKAEIERAGRREREGQSRRRVKAEITGYPSVITVYIYLRLPRAISLPIFESLQIIENVKQSPVWLWFLIGLQNP